MAGEKTIATLVGKLRFEADYRPLMNFEKKLDAVSLKMQHVLGLGNKKVTMKIGLDLRGLSAKIKAAEAVQIKLNNVKLSREAIERVHGKLETIGAHRITLSNIRISMQDIRAQKILMRSLFESTTIDLPVDVKLRAAEKALRAWKKTTEEKFKLYINADISRKKLLNNIRQSLRYVTGKIGTIRIPTPKIKLTVDRVALRAEIALVLAQIEREAKIRIRLTGDVSGHPRPGPGGGGGGGAGRGALAGGIAGAAGGFGRGLVPGLGGAFAIMQLNKINQELQGQALALTSVTGSADAGKVQQKFVDDLAARVGLVSKDVTPAFTKMLASGTTAGMTTEDIQKIFTGTSEFGRVMGLDSESMKSSFKAIEQMINKQQIMSEELKGQLAEQMPGVVSAMAEAAGFGTDDGAAAKLFKAMEKGEVDAAKTLVKFVEILGERARQGGALDAAVKSTAAEQSRFLDAFNKAVPIFAAGGFDRGMSNLFGDMARSLTGSEHLIRALGGAFEYLSVSFAVIPKLIANFSDALPNLSSRLGLSEKGLIGLGTAALINLTPLGRMLSIFSGLLLAAEDFATFMSGDGESVFGNWFNDLTPEKQEVLVKFGTAITDLAGAFATLSGMVWDGWSSIFGYFEESGLGYGVLSVITDIIERITDLVRIMDAFKNGNGVEVLGEIGLKNISAAGKVFNMAGDSLLPGNPLQNSTAWMQGISGAELKEILEFKAARATADRSPAGQPAALPNGPLAPSTVNINISGAGEPEVVGRIVQNTLESMFHTTRTNLVETKK